VHGFDQNVRLAFTPWWGIAELDLFGSRVLVDVFFLRVVEAHEGFNRLDDALRVADEIAVGVLSPQPVRQPRQQSRQMEDFTVRAAHGGETMSLVQDLRKTRIDAALIVALVLDDLPCDETVRLANQDDRSSRGRIIQGIGDLT
jgi:hypothetical protein